jgi:hypothetical protein
MISEMLCSGSRTTDSEYTALSQTYMAYSLSGDFIPLKQEKVLGGSQAWWCMPVIPG